MIRSRMNKLATRAVQTRYRSLVVFAVSTVLIISLSSLSAGKPAPSAASTVHQTNAPSAATAQWTTKQGTTMGKEEDKAQPPNRSGGIQVGRLIRVAEATHTGKLANLAKKLAGFEEQANSASSAAGPKTSGPQVVKTPSEPSKAPPDQAGLPMEAMIQPVAETSRQRVSIPVGRGIMVDVTNPIKLASVADPEIADVTVLSAVRVLVTGKAVGSTEILLENEFGQQLVFEVVIELDLSDIREAIARAAPGSEIEVRAVRDTIILSGLVADVDMIDRVLEVAKILTPKVQNQLRLAGEQQVLLRCTVAEVSKQAIRRLGVNGWMAGDNIRDMFVVNQLDGINPVNIGGAPVGNIIQPGGIPFATDRDGLSLLAPPAGPELAIGFPRVQMHLFFRAMRQNNLLRILAEPNLVALSGQEATFLAGGEFPYPVPQSSANQTSITIEYREYGIRLKFLPTVIGQQMIRLQVQPEVSEPDFTLGIVLAGTTVPGISERKAQTTIELASGSTIAIAGLLSESVRASSTQIPGLGDVPILGALFRSVEYRKNLSELVILVTPELVKAMHPDQVATVPGQFHQDPDDLELFGLGLLEGKPAVDETQPESALETELKPRYRKFSTPPEQTSLHGPWGHAESWETVQ